MGIWIPTNYSRTHLSETPCDSTKLPLNHLKMRLTLPNCIRQVHELTIKYSNLPERYIKRSMEQVRRILIYVESTKCDP